jgi:hypothetical protein
MNERRLIEEFREYYVVSSVDSEHVHHGEGIIGPVRPERMHINGNAIGCIDLRKLPYTTDGYVELAYLFIYNQQEGHGSNVLDTICNLADKYNLEVELDAVPIVGYGEPISMGKLQSIYRKFGFKHSEVAGSNKMNRYPHV